MRDANPSRRIPADASTSASNSPASSLRRRVSTLPRIGREARAPAGASRAARSGERCPVPIAARCRVPQGPRRDPLAMNPLRARSRRADPRAAGPPATVRPSGSTADMSFALCTARSIAPPSSASSISLTKSRLPPASESGASWSLSPDVLIVTSSAVATAILDEPRDGPRLPERELAAARPDPQSGHDTFSVSCSRDPVFSSVARPKSRWSASA